jgi:hypothetical protein
MIRVIATALPLLLATAGSPVGTLADGKREVMSRIAPGLAIVTEIGNSSPYVGQQFSIIYSLRALKAPSAVDIDPQQFTGFWTELSPPADARPSDQSLENQPASQYLLRQVIAFPLSEGKLQLPPLRLKIKMPDSRSGPGDWDLVCSSDPVFVDVLPVPNVEEQKLALVGDIEGGLTSSGSAGGSEVILELQGTANLAFFDPLQWIGTRPGVVLSVRPAEWDKLVQTRDLGGKRQITLLQRRSWYIRVLGQGTGPVRVGGGALPIFQPLTGVWREPTIGAITIAGLDVKPAASAPVQLNHSNEGIRTRSAWIVALIAGLLTAVALCACVRARRLRQRDWAARGLASLDKASEAPSKRFVDTAHKLMERYAAEAGIRGRIGSQDSELDRLWNEVEGLRFGRRSPSAELRGQILQFLKNLLADFHSETHPSASQGSQESSPGRKPGVHLSKRTEP